MSARRVCVVMAFDSAMVYQARECLDLLRTQTLPGWELSLVVLDLGLTDAEKKWLASVGAVLATNAEAIPNFPDAPGYMRAMTCRPYMRDLLPGYELYVWMDADIRLVAPGALQAYVLSASANREAIAICQEVDPCYGFVNNPHVSRNYHGPKRRRMAVVYGEEIAEKFDGFLCYNAGMFAMHRDSLIWNSYRVNLERAMRTPFDHMKEQDAMNVAIMQNGGKAVNLSALFNWLCSAAQPVFSEPLKRWVRPWPPQEVVSVLHLAAVDADIVLDGKKAKMRDYYVRLGLMK
jgi:hypothetical protein